MNIYIYYLYIISTHLYIFFFFFYWFTARQPRSLAIVGVTIVTVGRVERLICLVLLVSKVFASMDLGGGHPSGNQ